MQQEWEEQGGVRGDTLHQSAVPAEVAGGGDSGARARRRHSKNTADPIAQICFAELSDGGGRPAGSPAGYSHPVRLQLTARHLLPSATSGYEIRHKDRTRRSGRTQRPKAPREGSAQLLTGPRPSCLLPCFTNLRLPHFAETNTNISGGGYTSAPHS